jgi:hypothetical protein
MAGLMGKLAVGSRGVAMSQCTMGAIVELGMNEWAQITLNFIDSVRHTRIDCDFFLDHVIKQFQ